ncbi:acyltransferase [Wenyingzhuangia sp. 1_MG-2023]|nr:acyltransferase [Wenyingzhuangia sp. 1_MG-2023]
MKSLVYFFYKGIRKIFRLFFNYFDFFRLKVFLFMYDIKHKKIIANGLPFFHIAKNTSFHIGDNFKMNNGLVYNPIGFPQPCTFVVTSGAKLTIGNNVGMSQTTIVCQDSIVIKDFVKFGGGVKIYDSDFHSLKAEERMDSVMDMKNKGKAPVVIGNHVFVGANSMILKGVTIGDNSIVGAGAVVTKDIPENQIWAGNPAKFIKSIG